MCVFCRAREARSRLADDLKRFAQPEPMTEEDHKAFLIHVAETYDLLGELQIVSDKMIAMGAAFGGGVRLSIMDAMLNEGELGGGPTAAIMRGMLATMPANTND